MTGPRIFTYDEALELFPRVRHLTRMAVGQVEALVSRLRSVDEMETKREELETAYQTIVETWAGQIRDLGCEVKGLWLVDWDTGDGYFCWRYPEAVLGHYHSYEDGFQGRVPIN